MSEPKAYLRIRTRDTHDLIHSVGLKVITKRHVKKVIRRIKINLAPELYVDDSEVVEARQKHADIDLARREAERIGTANQALSQASLISDQTNNYAQEEA